MRLMFDDKIAENQAILFRFVCKRFIKNIITIYRTIICGSHDALKIAMLKRIRVKVAF